MANVLPPQWFQLLKSWSDEVYAKLDRVSLLIGDRHRPSEGSYRETQLRQLLRRVLPRTFKVSTGFIYGWNEPPSKQLDVIVWRADDGVPFIEEDEFVVVEAEHVEAIIEVKTTATRAELRSALHLLHPPEYVSWRFAKPPEHIKGVIQQVPSVPFRGFVAFYDNLATGSKSSSEVVFEEIANFYSALYGHDAKAAMTDGGSVRNSNLIDGLCIGPSLHVEQAHIAARDADGRVVDSVPGLSAFNSSSDSIPPDIALGQFCITLKGCIERGGSRFSHASPSRGVCLPWAAPGVLSFCKLDASRQWFAWSVEVPSDRLWHPTDPLW